MSNNTKLFKDAISASLEKLLGLNEEITIKSVINNAIFLEGKKKGKSVGESTLYKKNKGEYVHQDLLLDIKKAKSTGNKKSNKPSKEDKLDTVNTENTDLRLENSLLVDLVVKQESQLLAHESTTNSNDNTQESYEIELYVLSSILSEFIPANSSIAKKAKSNMNLYERKYGHDKNSLLSNAKDEIKEYISNVNYSTLTLVP